MPLNTQHAKMQAFSATADIGTYQQYDKAKSTVYFYICPDYANTLYGYCKDIQRKWSQHML